jgi:hypothetical protein
VYLDHAALPLGPLPAEEALAAAQCVDHTHQNILATTTPRLNAPARLMNIIRPKRPVVVISTP